MLTLDGRSSFGLRLDLVKLVLELIPSSGSGLQ
jgi:hypothetical protein